MSWWSEPTSKHAFILSWVSVILEAGAAVAGIAFFMMTGSTLCLVFGLENCVDLLSSVAVLWRFYCPGKITKEVEEHLQKREKRASIAISFVMILLGLGVIGAAADDLAGGAESEYDLNVLLVISFVSVFIFGGLTFIKFRYADRLSSASLHKDGLCSLIGTVLAIALFVNTLIIEGNPSVWWMDPVVAMLCGLAALLLGFQAIYIASCVQGLPIFTAHWWAASQGDGMDEMGGRTLNKTDFGTESELEMQSSEAATEPASEKAVDTSLSEVV